MSDERFLRDDVRRFAESVQDALSHVPSGHADRLAHLHELSRHLISAMGIVAHYSGSDAGRAALNEARGLAVSIAAVCVALGDDR